MTCRAQIQLRWRLFFGMAVTCWALTAGCQGTIGDPLHEPKGTTSGPATGTGTGGAGGGGPTDCMGTDVTASKRLIRLTFNQVVNSIGSLLGNDLARAVAAANSIPDATERSFPPLSNPREGTAITDSQWSKGDSIAAQVGKYVFDNFATVTGCQTASDACAQQFITTFAEHAYRRPLTAAETASLAQVYTEVKAANGTVNEGVQYSVYAVIESPQFLYRTEFGADWKEAGPLSPYEMASQLSYFIGDAPPDVPLLDAARQQKLASSTDIDAQATRLLASDVAKTNLEQAMFAYFGATNVLGIVIPDLPEFTVGLKNSMYQESVLFMNNTLWGARVADLVTSRRTYINTTLATLYGVTPPPGSTDSNFVAFDLPDTRAGLLTSPGFLVSRSRPDKQSVVGRGLLVNASILCGQNPQFNPDLQGTINSINAMQMDLTERDRSKYRTTTAPCSGCHPIFDPYGLMLENFDILARYRTVDEKGRPIDASVTLPPNAGGAMVKNAAEMAAGVASNGAFAACLAKNLLLYGLAEPVALSTDSCATKAVMSVFNAGNDPSFAALVRAVAASKPIGTRSPGGM